MIQLFKDGDSMAIRTDCQTEDDFIGEFSEMFNELIGEDYYQGDWEFQLRMWLPQFVELCCAFRGYKNVVDKKTVMTVGNGVFVVPQHEFDPRKNQLEVAKGNVNGPRVKHDRPKIDFGEEGA